MSEIPDDIMAKAREVALEIGHATGSFAIDRGADIIARAILAERDRAAKVACDGERTFGASRPLMWLNGYIEGRKDAATAIRSGK